MRTALTAHLAHLAGLGSSSSGVALEILRIAPRPTRALPRLVGRFVVLSAVGSSGTVGLLCFFAVLGCFGYLISVFSVFFESFGLLCHCLLFACSRCLWGLGSRFGWLCCLSLGRKRKASESRGGEVLVGKKAGGLTFLDKSKDGVKFM